MWECGLKPAEEVVTAPGKESLLMWECGLKLNITHRKTLYALSLLMWECGLKRMHIAQVRLGNYVTPYVGVWIETNDTFCILCPTSLLMWECGLKQTYTNTVLTCKRHSLCGSVD